MEISTAKNWHDFLTFGEEGPVPQTLIENERVRVIVAGLRAGQRIPVHPESAAVYHFLEGRGFMMVDNEEFPVQPGTVIYVTKGSTRGMRAETQLVFVATRLAQ